ncbi:Ig-like domain-containing protein [Lentilactobacillus sp. Marseille-Q4993]|uniref:Ig-like domain-containing protein n=1 Tax=Lentilactobacillus sp. Marseille-Q4993 TaxID=3039492 RepID=UPI0024BCD4E0|nr:Ig-like domain-containing protein [Lentilactobacillus sp. Marseille-Q4993]
MKRNSFLVLLFAIAAFFVGGNITHASSPSLNVDDLYSNSTSITGDATKGSTIYVRNSDKKTIAKSTADAVNGKFQVTLSTELKAGQKLYVYARKSTGEYFYRIVHVQTSQSASTAVAHKNSVSNSGKSTTKKTSSTKKATSSSKISISDPTGTWKSGKNSGYQVVTKFSQSTGLNQYLYHNGKYQKKLINYAVYKVSPKTTNFWKITYRQRHHKATQTMYIHFSSNKHFWIVNSKNQVIKVKYGNAPAHTYRFDLQ